MMLTNKISNNESINSLKQLINQFISYKQSLGYKYYANEKSLNRFVKFSIDFNLIEPQLSKKWVEAYISKRPEETPKNHANRVNELKQFTIYLNELGHEAYIPPKNKAIKHSSSFVPYIFTHNEISRIFQEVDNLKPNPRYNSAVVYPVLIRMLYSCGLRISEALNLKINSVDLEHGVLTIKKSKFEKDRIVPISESLNMICNVFYKQIHKNSTEEEYFFKNQDGSRRNKNTVGRLFRKLLCLSNIPYNGKGKGPRLHDLRHTFCCHSFKKIADEKIGMYSVLPILSTYIGHSSIQSTEKYIRLTQELYPSIIKSVEHTTSCIYPEVYQIETY